MNDENAPTKIPPSVPSEILLDCIHRLGRVVDQLDSPDDLIGTIIAECRRLLDCEAASLAIYYPERSDLEFIASAGGTEEEILRFRLPLGEGIAGAVAKTRQGIIVNDPAAHPGWCPRADQNSGFTTRNLAAVPILYASRLVGILEAINIRRGEGFADQDLYVLQIFADQIGTVLETQRLIAEKNASDRLASFAVALADIGHSVKNMLMRLGMPVDLIDGALAARNWETMDKVWPVLKRASIEIGDLVKEMLYYSKPHKPELEPANLCALASDIVEICRPDAESKGIELHFQRPADSLVILLDPRMLRPAIQNLVGNAIEALAELGGANVWVELSAEDQEVRLSVRDDGPGIPLEIQSRIFEPFFSTKKAKGTGLGLANVRKTAQEHGGRVELVSAPGEGAAFTIHLPRKDASSTPRQIKT